MVKPKNNKVTNSDSASYTHRYIWKSRLLVESGVICRAVSDYHNCELAIRSNRVGLSPACNYSARPTALAARTAVRAQAAVAVVRPARGRTPECVGRRHRGLVSTRASQSPGGAYLLHRTGRCSQDQSLYGLRESARRGPR